jgi:hypothetical protein
MLSWSSTVWINPGSDYNNTLIAFPPQIDHAGFYDKQLQQLVITHLSPLKRAWPVLKPGAKQKQIHTTQHDVDGP